MSRFGRDISANVNVAAAQKVNTMVLLSLMSPLFQDPRDRSVVQPEKQKTMFVNTQQVVFPPKTKLFSLCGFNFVFSYCQ